MHSTAWVELAVVVMCESSTTLSLPLPRKFHQLYAELLIPLKDENEQDRSDLSSTIINRYLSTVITMNPITFIQNPIDYSMGSPISKQPT